MTIERWIFSLRQNCCVHSGGRDWTCWGVSQSVWCQIIGCKQQGHWKSGWREIFQEDCFTVLTFPDHNTPLRREDMISVLVDYFTDKSLRQAWIRKRLFPDAIELCQLSLKGNVRELENCIERAIILCEAIDYRDNIVLNRHCAWELPEQPADGWPVSILLGRLCGSGNAAYKQA